MITIIISTLWVYTVFEQGIFLMNSEILCFSYPSRERTWTVQIWHWRVWQRKTQRIHDRREKHVTDKGNNRSREGCLKWQHLLRKRFTIERTKIWSNLRHTHQMKIKFASVLSLNLSLSIFFCDIIQK